MSGKSTVFVLSGLDDASPDSTRKSKSSASSNCPMDVESSATTPPPESMSDGNCNTATYSSDDEDAYSLELDLQRNISPSFIGFSDYASPPPTATAADGAAPAARAAASSASSGTPSPRSGAAKSRNTVDNSTAAHMFTDNRYRQSCAYGSYKGYNAFGQDNVETANAMIKRVRAKSEILKNAEALMASPRALKLRAEKERSASRAAPSPRGNGSPCSASSSSKRNATHNGELTQRRHRPRQRVDTDSFYDTYSRGSNTQRFPRPAECLSSSDLYAHEMRKLRTNFIDLHVDEATIVYVAGPPAKRPSKDTRSKGRAGGGEAPEVGEREKSNLVAFVTQEALPRTGSGAALAELTKKENDGPFRFAPRARGGEGGGRGKGGDGDEEKKGKGKQDKYSYDIKHKYITYTDHADDPITMALPEVVLAHVLSFVQPWDDELYLVNKRWCRTMIEYVPHLRLQPPCLPCTVQLEMDVRSNRRVVSRHIYTLNQMLWDLPMSVQRWEWRPGQYCRARQDWTIDEETSWAVWKYIRKSLRKSKGMSDDNPHYCEMKMHEDVLMKGYLSNEDSNKFIRSTLCAATAPPASRVSAPAALAGGR